MIKSAIPDIIEFYDSSYGNTTSVWATQLRALRIFRALKVVVRFGSLKMVIMTILNAFVVTL
jgi:hypothetical protein